MKSTEEYNGWTNWHTWNAYNWITSYEGSYMRACECRTVDRLKNEFGPYVALKDSINPEKVNWEELFKNL